MKEVAVPRLQALVHAELEQAVALAIREYILQDDVIQWIADRVIEYQKKQKDNPEIELLHSQLADVKLSISNIMKAIEAGIFTDTTKDRLETLEAEQSDISAKISAAEYNIVDVDRENVVSWLESFREGSIKDPKYLNDLFNTFVSAVYVYDDKKVKVVFSIGGDEKKTVDLTLLDDADDTEECSFKLSSGVTEQTQTNSVSLVMINGVFVLSFFMVFLRSM